MPQSKQMKLLKGTLHVNTVPEQANRCVIKNSLRVESEETEDKTELGMLESKVKFLKELYKLQINSVQSSFRKVSSNLTIWSFFALSFT